MDNDFGEHWFDNWDEREQAEERAKQLGLIPEFLFFIDPNRFKDEKDGPCHSSEERKQFWTDVCKSLHLSIETITTEAKNFNEEIKKKGEPYIQDLEERIKQITNRYKIL
jgi:ABC-type Fe3+-hydroxamate transport system substrate-binding protein